MKRLVGLVIAGTIATFAGGATRADSVHGCSNLSSRQGLQVVEGREGVFYRVDPDLKNFHPFSDETVALVAELSDALAELGTQLVYLPVPTKSLAMPGHLSDEARDFGFDADLATTMYLDTVKRLEAAGVATVDVRGAMVRAGSGAMPYFQADHRWTSAGSRIAAAAVAARLGQDTGQAKVQTASYGIAAGDLVTLDSAMRARIQRDCLLKLPEVQTVAHTTARFAGAGQPAAPSIFGPSGGPGAGRIAVVGTEYTGEPATNFAGFLAEATGREVVQYHVAGGGAFAAISSYLTSDAFQAQRPAVLVWENPVENNLAQSGDQPLRELIAAGGSACRVPLNLFSSGSADAVRVDLNALDPMQDYTLFLDTDGTTSRRAVFTFHARTGETRRRIVERHPGQVATGRFFVPMSGLWEDGASALDIALGVPLGANPRVTACFYSGKG